MMSPLPLVVGVESIGHQSADGLAACRDIRLASAPLVNALQKRSGGDEQELLRVRVLVELSRHAARALNRCGFHFLTPSPLLTR
jgi:hypothetical protein